jgi:hypothetical protein
MTARALRRECDLEDEALADRKEELIEAERAAVDETGEILVWTGGAVKGEMVKGGGIVRYERRKQDHTSPSPIESCVVSSQGSASGHKGSVAGRTAAPCTLRE